MVHLLYMPYPTVMIRINKLYRVAKGLVAPTRIRKKGSEYQRKKKKKNLGRLEKSLRRKRKVFAQFIRGVECEKRRVYYYYSFCHIDVKGVQK